MPLPRPERYYGAALLAGGYVVPIGVLMATKIWSEGQDGAMDMDAGARADAQHRPAGPRGGRAGIWRGATRPCCPFA